MQANFTLTFFRNTGEIWHPLLKYLVKILFSNVIEILKGNPVNFSTFSENLEQQKTLGLLGCMEVKI